MNIEKIIEKMTLHEKVMLCTEKIRGRQKIIRSMVFLQYA